MALHDPFGLVNMDLLGAAGNSKVPVLGGRITPLDLDATVSMLLDMVRCRTGGYVCIANVHTTMLALQVNEFRKALDGAALVVADGMPVVWRVRAAGYPGAGRVHGADLVHAACAAGIPYGLRHSFFGGLESVAEAMIACLRERYPSIQLRECGILVPLSGVRSLRRTCSRQSTTADAMFFGSGSARQSKRSGWLNTRRTSRSR